MKICVQCKRELDEKQFYRDRSGYLIEFCKDCAAKDIDMSNPHNTPTVFIRLDIPIYDVEWHSLDYKQFPPREHLSRYIAKMKLYGFRHWRYKDTDEVNSWQKHLEERWKEALNND